MPEDESKSNKKTRKPRAGAKDPAAPKRAKTAFLAFFSEKRVQLLKENPNLKFHEIGSLVADVWNNFSDQEKAPYIKMAEKDKERYLQEKAEYDAKKATK